MVKPSEFIIKNSQLKSGEYQENPEQQFLDGASVIFIVLNREGQIIKVNKKTTEVLGYSAKELLGKNWFENFIPAERKEEIKQIFKKLISEELELTKHFENSIITKDNKIKQIAWHNKLYRGSENKIIGILSSGEDVTERNKNKELIHQQNAELKNNNIELRLLNKKLKVSIEREQFLADLVRNSSQAVGIAYPDGTGKFLNKKGYDLLGYTEAEIIQIKWHDITPENWLQSEQKELLYAIKSHKPVTYIKEYIAKSGRKIPVELSVHPHFNKKGRFLYFTAFITDITERLQHRQELLNSEEKYRTLYEQSSDPILIIEDFRFIQCNDATVKFLGYNNQSEFIMRKPHELSPEYQSDGIKSDVKAKEMIMLSLKNGHHRFEWIHLKANNEERWIDVSLTHIQATNQIYTIWRDITERKKVEKELQEYHNHLEDSVRSRTHELEEKNEELERFNRLFVGREFRIKELRDKVKELELKLKNKEIK